MDSTAWLATIVLAVTLLAGCIGAPTDPTEADDPSTEPLDGPRVGVASGLPETRNGTTLADAPDYALGEWWTVKYEDRLSGGSGEITRVVAGADSDSYLVGMTNASFSEKVMLLHFPGMGRIDRANLSFDAHDRPIQLLDFPLKEGRTWETQYYGGQAMTGEVVQAEDGTASVVVEGDGPSIELTYDAELGAIAELTISGYLHYEVVDHGVGIDEPVTVPYEHDLVFCHGRVVVQAIEPCALSQDPDPQPPRETITLSDEYDRASFGLLMADLVGQEGVGQGVYRVSATAPDGSTYSAEKLPTDGPIKLVPYGQEDPGGDWEATYVAGGAGFSLLEGVAYETLTVDGPGV